MALTPIIDTAELVIYAPPDTINLVSDIGAQGDRGSLIFSNVGHPDTYTSNVSGYYTFLSETLKSRDMYYRVEQNTWYQWTGSLWQLRSGIKRLFTIKKEASFTSGESTVVIPISELWGNIDITNITESDIFVAIQPESSTVNSFITLKSKVLNTSTDLTLNVVGLALNLANTVFTPLDSQTISLQILISLV